MDRWKKEFMCNKQLNMKQDQAYKNVNCTHENYFKKIGNYLFKIRYPARENICIGDNII